MILTSRDTLGGYRIELCSENKEEERLLKEIEEMYKRKDLQLLNTFKNQLKQQTKGGKHE